MSTDHLAIARGYIAIAESEDSKREAYMKAADEIIAWLAEDTTRSNREAARQVGKSDKWVGDLVRWRTSANCTSTSPFADDGTAQRAHARRTLRERPEDVVPEIAEAIKTNSAVRDAAAKAIAGQIDVPSTPASDLAAAKRVMAHPEMAAEVVKDEQVRQTTTRAIIDNNREGFAQDVANDPETADIPALAGDLTDAIRSKSGPPRQVSAATAALVDALSKMPEWFATYGDIDPETQDEDGTPDGTLGEQMKEDLTVQKAKIDAAFDALIFGGVETVEDFLRSL